MSTEQFMENGIAVIGFSGRFPGAVSCSEFWENLCAGRESVTFFDREMLLKEGIAEALLNDPNYIKAAPILKDIRGFDAQFFNFSPREAIALDPQQRIFLELCVEALEFGGYFGSKKSSIGVYAGSGDVISNYLLHYLKSYPEIEQRSGSFQHLANDKDYLATRVSYKLDLNGPSIAVQTACSTSLVAVHLACQALLDGECDMALAGGINVRVPHYQGYYRQEGDIYSPDGHVRTFDEQAGGVLFGSGGGVVLLKLLDQAIADGDKIYAYIRGTAVNNDGGSKLSYTASSYLGQIRCIERAIRSAEIDPQSLQYIEAHGTATQMGDPIEVAALAHVLGGKPLDAPFCGIGSVKSNIGHLDAAAGIAGLIKAVLMLHHQYMPPTINYTNPNPRLKLDKTPLYVVSSGRDWKKQATPRRCGVNGLGIGGTNAFIILEEAPFLPKSEINTPLPKEFLFVLSAKTNYSLEKMIIAFCDYLEKTDDGLADICFTAATGRCHFDLRIAVVAQTTNELLEKLRKHNVSSTATITKDKELELLQKTYLAGEIVDWVFYYEPYLGGLRKVALPTYAFDRQRYWLDSRPAAHRLGYGPRVHELLGSRLPGSGDEVRFFNQLQLTEQTYLRSHEILGFVLMPGAAFMESALASGRLIQGGFPIGVRELSLQRPLSLVETCPCDYEVRLKPNALGYGGYIESHQEGHAWVTHCSFELSDKPKASYEVVSIEGLKEEMRQQDINGLYARFAALGYHYGKSFQVIDAAFVGRDELLAHVRGAESVNTTDYLLHPTLLDGALQAMVLLGRGEQSYIPAQIDALVCYRALGNSGWVYIQGYQQTAQQVEANLSLYDEEGVLVASLQGVSARATDNASLARLLSPEDASVYLEHEEAYALPEYKELQEAVFWWSADERVLPDGVLRFDAETMNTGHHLVLINPESFDALFLMTQQLLGTPPKSLTLVVLQGDPKASQVRGFWRSVRHEQGSGVRLYWIQSPSVEEAKPIIECLISNQLTEPEVVVREGQYFVPRLDKEEARDAKMQHIVAPKSNQYLVTESGIDGLHWAIRAEETLGATQVRVRIKATGLNFRDVLHAMNLYPGHAGDLGYEAAGEVLAVGATVEGLAPGARVVLTGSGLLAGEAVVDERQCVVLPDALSFSQGAALPIVYLTAHYGLVRLAQLKKGQSVLIHAATGGVGLAAIALAKQAGATIYATASQPKQAYLKKPGIEWVYDSRTTDFGAQILHDTQGEGVDVVLNSLTSEGFIESSLSCLKKKGVFLEIGKRHIKSQKEMQALREDVAYHIIDLGERLKAEPEVTRRELQALVAQCASGALKTLPVQEYSVHETISAMHTLQQAKHVGKVVLTYPQPFSYKEGATYMITGGAGGLGLRLAEYLIEQGVRHLVLTSRRAASEALGSWMKSKEAQGITIRHEALDVTDKAALSRLVESIKQSPYPLKGVFHAAGVLHDGVLANLTLEDVHEVLAPKVLGATYLDELTQKLNLDCFVLFSSIASLLGSPGQSNYAAANGYLDGLARARHARGLPALSVNWGPFAEVGMAAALEPMHRALGFMPLHTATAFPLMQAHFNQGKAQISLFNKDWSKTDFHPYLSHLVVQRHLEEGEWLSILSAIPKEQRESVFAGLIKQELAQVLLLEPAQIDADKSFFDLGMDSLMAVEFKNKLQQRLGDALKLGNTTALDHNSVTEMREYFLELLPSLMQKKEVIIEHKEVSSLSKEQLWPVTMPLNFRQMYLWYAGKKVGHTISQVIEINSYSVEKVRMACKKTILSHPALWLFFDKKYPLLHFISMRDDWVCRFVDLRGHANQTAEIEKLFSEYAQANYWYNREPPMIECIVIQKEENAYSLHIHVSHAVFDGYSALEFCRQLQDNLKDKDILPVQWGELDNQFLYNARHADKVMQIEQVFNLLRSTHFEYFHVKRTWAGRMFPQDVTISLQKTLIEPLYELSRKLKITYSELVFVLCMVSLHEMAGVKKLFFAYLTQERDEENKAQFGYIANLKFLIMSNHLNDLVERTHVVVNELRQSPAQDPVKGAQLMYAIPKEGLMYRLLTKLLRYNLFPKYTHLYYPQPAIDEYVRAGVLEYLSRPSFWTQSVRKTLIYNDVTFRGADLDKTTHYNPQQMSVSSQRRKLHGRQFILAKANSELIEFTFQNWEGDVLLLKEVFVKQFETIIYKLFASMQ